MKRVSSNPSIESTSLAANKADNVEPVNFEKEDTNEKEKAGITENDQVKQAGIHAAKSAKTKAEKLSGKDHELVGEPRIKESVDTVKSKKIDFEIQVGLGFLQSKSDNLKFSFAALVSSLSYNHEGHPVEEMELEDECDKPSVKTEKWQTDFITMVIKDCLLLNNPEQMVKCIVPLAVPISRVNSVPADTTFSFPKTRANICGYQNAGVCRETAQSLAKEWLEETVEIRIRAVAELMTHTLINFNGYDARVRLCIVRLHTVLQIPHDVFMEIEYKVSHLLLCDSSGNMTQTNVDRYAELEDAELKEELVEDTEDKDFEKEHLKKKKSDRMRMFKIGAAAVVGGTLIGLTGGLAAPAIGAGMTAVGGSAVGGSLGIGAFTAGLGTFLGTAGGTALAVTVFGATGAGLNGYKMSRRIGKSLKEFWFHQLSVKGNQDTLSLLLAVPGWLPDADEIPGMWDYVGREEDFDCRYLLVWERKILNNLGNAFEKLAVDQAVGMAVKESLKHTTLAALMAAVAWPATILSAASLIDNPWSVALNRAKLCGEELANVLINRKKTFGNRPISLYAYSVGATAIFYCLQRLAEAKSGGENMFGYKGIVENVYFVGACISQPASEWLKVRSVVSGRLVNAYSPKDWILSFLYRSSGTLDDIAGLSPITCIYGVENINLSKTLDINYHYEYASPGTSQEIASYLKLYQAEDSNKSTEACDQKYAVM